MSLRKHIVVPHLLQHETRLMFVEFNLTGRGLGVGVERACAEREEWPKLVHNGTTKAESRWRKEGQPRQKQAVWARTA